MLIIRSQKDKKASEQEVFLDYLFLPFYPSIIYIINTTICCIFLDNKFKIGPRIIYIEMPLKFDKNNKTLVLRAFSIIVLLALIIRLKDIASFPFNFDEGIHGYHSYVLYKTMEYEYLPGYHGPFLYYITAGTFALLGDDIITARLMPTLFGVAMVLLLYPIRKYLGVAGFLATSVLLAFSPLFVTYSQECRNDVFLTFFTLATVVCVLLYLEKKKNMYLVLGAASLALTFTVKENAYITLFIFASFLVLCYLHKILKSGNSIKAIREAPTEIAQIFMCIVVFLLIYIAPFFMHPNGFLGGWSESFYFWFNKIQLYGQSYPPIPFHFYLDLLVRYELPVLILATAGGIYYSLVERNRLMQFTFYWAVASLAIYSFMPYKRSWLSLHMLLPLILIAGAFLGRSLEFLLSKSKTKKGERIFAVSIVIILIACHCAHALNNASSLHYTTPTGEYEELCQYLNGVTDGKFQTTVIVVPGSWDPVPIYWPLIWHIREHDFMLAEFPTEIDKETIDEMVGRKNLVFISSKRTAEHLDAFLQELDYEKKAFDSVRLVVHHSK